MNHEQMRHTKFMERIPSSISNLRVVEVEGIDLCPCAGTHVENTSSIPNIEFVSKKNKGKGRIRFSYTFCKMIKREMNYLVGSAGIEPAIFAMSRRRHNP